MIHKNELKTLKDQSKDINDLVTNKETFVYKFKAVNGNQLYFRDYNNAKLIYENQIAFIGELLSII